VPTEEEGRKEGRNDSGCREFFPPGDFEGFLTRTTNGESIRQRFPVDLFSIDREEFASSTVLLALVQSRASSSTV